MRLVNERYRVRADEWMQRYEHVALLHDCITRRLGFLQPKLMSMRIEAHCEELSRSGTCKQRDAQKPRQA